MDRPAVRPFKDLRDAGLLWLINRSVLHPRGYAIALVVDDDGEATGWLLLGDGSEPWSYDIDEAERFAQVETTFRNAGATTAPDAINEHREAP